MIDNAAHCVNGGIQPNIGQIPLQQQKRDNLH
jgi:hypothetical protein